MNDLHKAIIGIYDAAIDEARWQDTLNSTIAYVGSKSASLMLVDTYSESPYTLSCLGGSFLAIPEELAAHYVANLSPLEADAWAYLDSQTPLRLVEDTEIYQDYEAVKERLDYRFLREHAGIERRVIARLNANRSWFDAAAFQFDAGQRQIPARSLEHAGHILPHLAKAFELGRTYRLLRDRYHAVIAALDKVKVGMCVVLADGTVVTNNTEAEKILSQGDGIGLDPKNRLACRDQELQANLLGAIASTSVSSAGEQGATEHQVTIARPSGKRPILGEISPIRDSLRELDRSFSGSIVVLIDPDSERSIDISRMTVAYKLTDAESQVCRLLVEGWTNEQIAEARNVSTETIKSQTATIMRKSGVGRRSDLIRLAVKTSPPVAKEYENN